jgi:hypothetical protein
MTEILLDKCYEHFEKNPNICDTDVKKGWFILGVAWESALSQKLKVNKDFNSYRGYKLRYTKEGIVFTRDTVFEIHNECFRLFIEYDQGDFLEEDDYYHGCPTEGSRLILNSPEEDMISDKEAQYYFLMGDTFASTWAA